MIVADTLAHRWWALLFIPVYFAVAVPARGWRAALRFWTIASVVSFAAEWSSTHNGFPYGRYAYVSSVHELHLANVPLFVPITFGVVVWAGRALASARTPGGIILGGAICATALDLVIDPVTLRGGQWFMGSLYRYAHGGYWFDVPWSNFGGWLLVSTIILALDNRYEKPNIQSKLLAIGIGVFFVIVGFGTGHERFPTTGLVITAALALWAFSPTLRRRLRR